MKKSMIKNIIICVLAVTCAFLVVRLWFGGTFFSVPATVISPTNHMASAMIELAQIAISSDGQKREVIYGNLPAQPAWEISADAISALIDRGNFIRSGVLSEEMFPAQNITIMYNFSMPTSFFREHFGQRPGFLSSVFANFETLVISPQQGEVNFFFIDGQGVGFYLFALQDAQIYFDLRNFITQRDKKPRYNTAFVQNPIGEPGELLLATVEPFMRFFFPNPAAIEAVTINGVYTYSDNFRVVKFYPSNIVEYTALLGRSPGGTTNFTTSLLAALDMLRRDAIGNDIFLAGYSAGPADNQWNFYFDYAVAGLPVLISENFARTNALNHAIEVRVINNAVVRYRRLMLDFHAGMDEAIEDTGMFFVFDGDSILGLHCRGGNYGY